MSIGLISKALGTALRFWLRSQIEQIEELSVSIEAPDRRVLKGELASVEVAGEAVIYQGIHLSQVHVKSQEVRVNLGQILKGQPLKLLAPVAIDLTLTMTQADLNASLTAPSVEEAVRGFLRRVLPDNLKLSNFQVTLAADVITLAATSGETNTIAIRSALLLETPNRLVLVNPQLLLKPTAKRGLPLNDFEGYGFDLGAETQIEQLCVRSGELSIQGHLNVLP